MKLALVFAIFLAFVAIAQTFPTNLINEPDPDPPSPINESINVESSGQSPRGPGHIERRHKVLVPNPIHTEPIHTESVNAESSGQSPRGPGHIERRQKGPVPSPPIHNAIHTESVNVESSGQSPRGPGHIERWQKGPVPPSGPNPIHNIESRHQTLVSTPGPNPIHNIESRHQTLVSTPGPNPIHEPAINVESSDQSPRGPGHVERRQNGGSANGIASGQIPGGPGRIERRQKGSVPTPGPSPIHSRFGEEFITWSIL